MTDKTAKNKSHKLRQYLWIAIFATNIIAILLLLGATQAWYFVPSKTVFFSYLGLAFPILVVVNILYLLFWIFTVKWQYALAEIIVLLLCWGALRTYMPMNEPSAHVPEESFRVLSYNVRNFNMLTGDKARENPIFDYILAQNADIMCFQEFAVAEHKSSKGIISKAEVAKKFKDYPHYEIIRLSNPNSNLWMGIAIYSKFPIKRTAIAPLYSTYNGCAFHELEINGKRVTLLNAHLESNRITGSDKKLYKDFLKSESDVKLEDVTDNIKSRMNLGYTVRETQTNIIRTHLERQDTYATIICGDFNDTPISYTYNTMKGDLIDSYVSTGRGIGITYHENMFLFRIDYIFHSIRLKAYNTTVGDVKYSDHYPIWTNLMFK